MARGFDDGTGGCGTGFVTPPTGTEQLVLSILVNGAVTQKVSRSFQVLPAPNNPTPTPPTPTCAPACPVTVSVSPQNNPVGSSVTVAVTAAGAQSIKALDILPNGKTSLSTRGLDANGNVTFTIPALDP